MLASFFSRIVLGNLVLDYIIFLLSLLLGFIFVKFFAVVVLKKIRSWADRTTSSLDDLFCDLISKVGLPLFYFGVVYFSLKMLVIPDSAEKFLTVLATAVLTIGVAKMFVIGVQYGFKVYLTIRGGDQVLSKSLRGMRIIARALIWGFAIIFFLDNLGFKISTVIAGLGIGGIAVALAAQAVLGDLFSYFAILFDRPFEIGDFIIVGDYLGVVEKVGIKTTHVRSLGGEQLVFSNTDLTNSRIRNYKRMDKRRVVFKLGVIYQTENEKLEKMSQIIKNIITGIKDTVFDRAHFSSYGDFSLNFEIVYYVIGADYNKYMDIQQEINLAIKKEFENLGIEFAYPTQTLFLEKS